MTLQDLLVLLVVANLLLSGLLLLRLGSVQRELIKLKNKRIYTPETNRRGRPVK